ncbi:hypothetical protein DZF91_15175 [Actinomadura logoneensis]|uniref:Uncharacterized protein n=1 Tax=Actinomadura logoneensis TaxID=2293572 RepID=A0A372JLU8_9ACTN|nr:hypothetical protein [Actinomadura logoneensis]RFU40814.1 hypothetical protein DZF91_15175 [Actinomadura logoneensis]
MPQRVRVAFLLMLAGAATQVLGLLVTVVRMGALRDQFRTKLAESGTTPTEGNLDAIMAVAIAFAVLFALLGAGLWLWMAFTNRAGRPWARITGTVFFGIHTLSTLSGGAIMATGGTGRVGLGAGDAASFAISGVTWLIGLATVILLWTGDAKSYFRPVAAAAPYGQPGEHPYGQPYGQPGGHPYGHVPPGHSPYPVEPPPPAVQPPPGDAPPHADGPNWTNPS